MLLVFAKFWIVVYSCQCDEIVPTKPLVRKFAHSRFIHFYACIVFSVAVMIRNMELCAERERVG